MTLFHLALKTLTLDHIKALIDNGTYEERQLDYKRELPWGSPSKQDKKKDPVFEFACDVSAMANSAGGDIVCGVEEDEETGRPLSIVGIDIKNWDDTRQRLEQMILDNIEPRIVGFDLHPILVEDDKYVVVIRVPLSFAGPHQVTKGRKKFWARHPGGKHWMDFHEIRSAFLRSGEAVAKARAWRDSRISDIANARIPLATLEKGPIQILHFVPLNFGDPVSNIPVDILAQQISHLQPVERTGFEGRYNVDGYFTGKAFGRQPLELNGYVQFFRNGQLESVRILHSESNKQIIGSMVENDILVATESFLTAMGQSGVNPPLLISLAFLDIGDYRLIIQRNSVWGGTIPLPIQPNAFTLPDVLTDEYPDRNSIPALMKPLIDAMWNSSGYSGSEFYDPTGMRDQPTRQSR